MCTKVKPVVLSPHMRVKRLARPRPVERVTHQIDAVRSRDEYGVHNNSLVNLVRGINERVFHVDNIGTLPTKPVEGCFKAIRCAREIKAFKLQPWTMTQVVESYQGAQQMRYRAAMESIEITPLHKRDARVATFIKAEKINFTKKPDPAPRVIQPRDPRFNVVFAKYIKPLEPMLYKALGRLYRYPCIAKGFNAAQTGEIIKNKWSCFARPACVGLDASRFDQHVSVDALKFTHSVYRRFIKNQEFNRLLEMMYVNRGVGLSKDGLVKYKVEGCRMSGDMDTALGNCVLMTLMTRQLCLDLNIEHELMDNGDDMIVIMEREKVDIFNAAVMSHFKTFGFTMKVEAPVYVLEQIEFCQTQPIFDGHSWRMVRQLCSISKDMCSVIDWEQLPAWWHAIGTCGLALAGDIPVFGAFYRWLCRIGKPSTKVRLHPLFRCGMVNLSRGMLYKGHTISPEARCSFAAGFHISIPMQLALEDCYNRMVAPVCGLPCDKLPFRDFMDWFTPDHSIKSSVYSAYASLGKFTTEPVPLQPALTHDV